MERTKIIKNFLDLVGMTKDERVSLIQALMHEWHLTENDIAVSQRLPAHEAKILPSASENKTSPETKEQARLQDTATPQETPLNKPSQKEDISVSEVHTPPKRRGRPKKVKEETSVQKTEATSSKKGTLLSSTSAPLIEEKKKTRGRPKKNSVGDNEPKTRRTKAKPIDKGYSPNDDNVNEDDAAIKAALSQQDIENLLNNEPLIRSKETRRRNPNFLYLADFPNLKPLIIGKEYPFEFLYQWKNKKLLSPYVLDGMMPLGIHIPYKNVVFGMYKGFIVSIYEEYVITDIHQAYQEAEKLPTIDNEAWSIMNSLQWSILKSYIGSINSMLSKVGGDSLKNNYRTRSPKSNLICGIGNLRYTVDVK